MQMTTTPAQRDKAATFKKPTCSCCGRNLDGYHVWHYRDQKGRDYCEWHKSANSFRVIR